MNIGSADGYFALGLLKSNQAQKALCFEATEKGRKAIMRNATENSLEDKVQVFGIADQHMMKKLKEHSFNTENSLVLCDIEGGEFDLFTNDLFNYLKGAKIIIELHDKVLGLNEEIRTKLIQKIPKGLSYKILKSQSLNWNGISTLEELSDNDRAVVLSEGRKKIGEWLIIN